MGAGSKQCIQSGGLCNGNSIACTAVALTDTVHNNQNNGLIHKYFLQNERLSKVMHSNGCIILHHNDKSYNPFSKLFPKSQKSTDKGSGFQHFFRTNHAIPISIYRCIGKGTPNYRLGSLVSLNIDPGCFTVLSGSVPFDL
jgi:hypothetical protein